MLGLLLLSRLVAVTAAPDITPLRYRLTNRLFQEVGRLPGQNLDPAQKPAEILLAQPDYTSEAPLYLTASLGSGEDPLYTLVLDKSWKGGGYDTLYVDRDNDQSLENEKPWPGYRREGALWFGPVPLLLAGPAGPYLHHLVCIYHPFTGPYGRAKIQTAGYYLGRAKIAGGWYRVALVDANGNGVFNDISGAPGEGDCLLIDRNGDGRFEAAEEDSEERYGLGRYLLFRDRYYGLTVPSEGASLALTRANPREGRLRGVYTPLEVQLSSKEGFLTLHSETPEVRVPGGTYQWYACMLEARNENGEIWRAWGRPPDPRPPLVIRQGETTPLIYGPPLRGEVTFRREAEEVEFRLTIRGRGGEEYGDFTRDGAPIPAPRLHLTQEEGKEIGVYDFDWEEGTYRLSWAPPDPPPGSLEALVEIDLGPFPVEEVPRVSLELAPPASVPPAGGERRRE